MVSYNFPPPRCVANVFQGDQTTTTSRLTRLPLEMQHAIFKCLGPVSSTCLGMTCKAFYHIHWSRHMKVRLWEADDPSQDEDAAQHLLGWYIRGWMYPLVLHCHDRTALFVTSRQLKACQKQRRKDAEGFVRRRRALTNYCRKFREVPLWLR
jgi:hypothetical protein